MLRYTDTAHLIVQKETKRMQQNIVRSVNYAICGLIEREHNDSKPPDRRHYHLSTLLPTISHEGVILLLLICGLWGPWCHAQMSCVHVTASETNEKVEKMAAGDTS
jgi:hypothetical protein